MLHCLSLGAGVQSTTMALMAAHGELSMPDCAIFADTRWEPRAVYEHLDRLEAALPFPVYRVSAGDLRERSLQSNRYAPVPWHVDGAIGRRQCTREFKLEPIAKKLRELLGYQPRQRIPPNSVECWIGISLDEATRMRPARMPWQINRWPLIDKGMRRRDCEAWLKAHNWSATKSACIGCPYHSNDQWRFIRDNDSKAWADAIYVDSQIRHGLKMRHQQFMHWSKKPLGEVDLSTSAEWGQLDLFNDECEGMCGV